MRRMQHARVIIVLLFALLGSVLAVNSGHADEDDKPFFRMRRSGLGTFNRSDIDGRWLPPRTVVFTFDDGPNEIVTPSILDALSTLNIKAVFFMVGKNIQRLVGSGHAHILHRLIREGHVLGSHTYDHQRLRSTEEVSAEDLMLSVDRCSDIITNVTGVRPVFLRAPYGTLDAQTHALLLERGYIVVGWDVDSWDWLATHPDNITMRVMDIIDMFWPDAGLILLHENQYTLEALPSLASALHTKRLQVSTLYDALPKSYLRRLWRLYGCSLDGHDQQQSTESWQIRSNTLRSLCDALRGVVLKRKVDGRLSPSSAHVQPTVFPTFFVHSP